MFSYLKFAELLANGWASIKPGTRVMRLLPLVLFFGFAIFKILLASG